MTKAAVAAALLFAILSVILIPYAGIEDDEAFFTREIYGPSNPAFEITVFHHAIPLMIWPYAGALKAWLYTPILRVFGPNAYSFRVPVVLTGTASILLFFFLARRLAGPRAALLAVLLLATDPSFLLSNTYDWGPVAMEHLLLMAGCLLVISRRPALGFFILGLGVWNKAVIVWALAGLAAGVAAAYWPELRGFLKDRRQLIRCACAFLAGALPLIVYNVHAPNATLRANIHPSFENFAAKVTSLRVTLDGSALFGVVAEPEWAARPKPPQSARERVSWWIRKRVGRHYTSLFVYALLVSLLAAPLWWRAPQRRPAVFAIVFSIVAFLTMALTRYTGAAHHVVLIWPMPHLLVGIALASLRPPWLTRLAAAILVAANLVVVNQYLVELQRNGAARLFTDASYALAGFFRDRYPGNIYVVDWNIEVNLNLLHRGSLHIVPVWPSMTDPAADAQRHEVEQVLLQDPNGIFVARVPELEQPPDSGARVLALARAAGYETQLLRVIPDSNGRPVFEVYRFVPSQGMLKNHG